MMFARRAPHNDSFTKHKTGNNDSFSKHRAGKAVAPSKSSKRSFTQHAATAKKMEKSRTKKQDSMSQSQASPSSAA